MSVVQSYRPPGYAGAIAEMKRRIVNARWPASVSADDWSRGVPTDYLRSIASYWVHRFDWEAWQVRLAAMPHFRTVIDGQPIHFLHYRSDRAGAVPLVITHGWPSSFLEFENVVPRLLRGNGHIAFDLVIPSLPGFAFSSPLQRFGWNHRAIATAWAELMSRLGYERFGACGGDTGSIVAPTLAKLFPGRLIGVHINGGLLRPDLTAEEYQALGEGERRRVDATSQLLRLGAGYAALQASRPQSLGFALSDSPVGLLGWMIEKFKEWTDPAKRLPEESLRLDDILSTVGLYWLTNTAASSANLYFEVREENETLPELPISDVPTGIAVFPTDPILRHRAAREYNIVHWSEYDRGGHFAAAEAPDLYASDVIGFFHQVGALKG